MLNVAFIVFELILLIFLGVLLWQVWKFLHDKSIPDDEPLGEQRANYLMKRIDLLKIVFVVMAVVQILHRVLQLFDVI